MTDKRVVLDLRDAEESVPTNVYEAAEDLLDFCERGYSEVGLAQDISDVEWRQ